MTTQTNVRQAQPDHPPRELRWHESVWPVYLAIIAALGLSMLIDPRLVFGDYWLMPLLGMILLVPLISTRPRPVPQDWPPRRVLAIILIGLINASNIVSLILLVRSMLQFGTARVGNEDLPGASLVVEAIKIWLVNILVFALWFWELDRGGPSGRLRERPSEPDFLFPQMTISPHLTIPHWRPTFVDYLFLSFTNATAFSPTDVLPLTPSAKLIMMVQALTSLLTIAFVAARAVNILK
ncbi:MAG: hypothetical protein M3014_04765 [Chloroflexota bacterium]|nr:hypothetical protein [Chloroflexota bacterium]